MKYKNFVICLILVIVGFLVFGVSFVNAFWDETTGFWHSAEDIKLKLSEGNYISLQNWIDNSNFDIAAGALAGSLVWQDSSHSVRHNAEDIKLGLNEGFVSLQSWFDSTDITWVESQHRVWHEASEIKIIIEGKNYSLQEVVDDGLIERPQQVECVPACVSGQVCVSGECKDTTPISSFSFTTNNGFLTVNKPDQINSADYVKSCSSSISTKFMRYKGDLNVPILSSEKSYEFRCSYNSGKSGDNEIKSYEVKGSEDVLIRQADEAHIDALGAFTGNPIYEKDVFDEYSWFASISSDGKLVLKLMRTEGCRMMPRHTTCHTCCELVSANIARINECYETNNCGPLETMSCTSDRCPGYDVSNGLFGMSSKEVWPWHGISCTISER